ncbi:MAG: hypothetical protein PHV97_04810, partial [Candidatus Omnitrophica bacterium]|nr:hypothetical protein [Candidatus Omnitrophota bacterium]
MKSAIAFLVAVTFSFFPIPALHAGPVDPASPVYSPMAEKAFVPEAVSVLVAVTYTPGLTTANVTTLPGNPLPRIMDGSSSSTSASLSSGVVAVKYDVKTAGTFSGLTVDFDNYATGGKETGNFSSLSKIAVGLTGTVNTVNLKFEDSNGHTGVFQLTQVSSAARYWTLDLGLLDPSVDKSRIKAIHFYVEQANVTAKKLTGTFSVRLNGLDILKPEAPLLASGTSTMFNQKTATISGTKEAYSSVYVNGILVALADSATTWTATVSLKKDGNNTVSLVAKSALGVASATRSVTFVRDMTAPKGSIKISN